MIESSKHWTGAGHDLNAHRARTIFSPKLQRWAIDERLGRDGGGVTVAKTHYSGGYGLINGNSERFVSREITTVGRSGSRCLDITFVVIDFAMSFALQLRRVTDHTISHPHRNGTKSSRRRS